MGEVSDEFLLAVAQTAATLLGLLLLGGFFYLETGLTRARSVGTAAEGFLRATVKFTLLLYTLTLAMSFGLTVLRTEWLVASFVLLGAAVVKTQVEWTLRYRELRRVLPLPWESTWVSWAATVVVLVLPWAIDGYPPGRAAFTASLLLAGAMALQSTGSLLLTTFDLAKLEQVVRPATEDAGDDLRG